MMFKTGIMPAWEDPQNKPGSEFKLELTNVRDISTLQKVWETLIFGCVTGNIPKVKDGVCGVRFMQKVKQFSLFHFRIEVWMSKGDENSEEVQAIKGFLEGLMKSDALKDVENLNLKFSKHS